MHFPLVRAQVLLLHVAALALVARELLLVFRLACWVRLRVVRVQLVKTGEVTVTELALDEGARDLATQTSE